MPPAAFRRLCVETFTDAFVRSTSNDQPPSGGCVLKHSHNTDLPSLHFQPPSGGCVLKLLLSAWSKNHEAQPPSGGCVLKQQQYRFVCRRRHQPPSGGCVLKQHSRHTSNFEGFQPPSGGCVLKPRYIIQNPIYRDPAAFRRLCVETSIDTGSLNGIEPAAFRRLCVETICAGRSFGRCAASRLQAAVC